MANRKSGILLHPSSLPSAFGVGDFGQAAYTFLDRLAEANQTLWQILPLVPTDAGGSPYSSASAFAGNPLLISPELLLEEGLLSEADLQNASVPPAARVDYEKAAAVKLPLLEKAFQAFQQKKAPADYAAFQAENAYWLADYALYTALKQHFLSVRATEEATEGFDLFCEECAGLSLPTEKLHEYYDNVSYDSADVWAHQKLFRLDSKGFPTCVTGVPPDYFSETGQLWGNPHYAWREHEKTGFAWWLSRIQKNLQDVDILRIDHFRGFSACWEVAFGAEDARGGKWASAPGEAFFTLLKEKLGSPLPLIAEDLGIITDEVAALRNFAGLPGMRILQFAFGQEKNNPYLPHCYDKNTVVYTGTHDNDTTNGWYQAATEQEKDHYRRYLNVDGSNAAWDFIRLALSSPADTAILPLQDVLSLGTEHRMNIPGTTRGNWGFTFSFDWWQEGFSEGLRYLSALFGRNEQAEKAAEETDEFLR